MSVRAILHCAAIGIIAFAFSFDLLVNPGTPASFDGPVHISNMVQIAESLKSGEFPRWGDGFANYGMPIPIIAQQTTSYLGGFFILLTNNPTFSYALVVFVGALLSCITLDMFFRKHVSPNASLVGIFLFNLAPYRIMNVYVRGALPEFFGSVFLPLILVGIYEVLVEKRKRGPLLIALGTTGTLLTHPFLIVIYAFLYIPYGLYYFLQSSKKIRDTIYLSASFVTGLLLSAYYILPLFAEIRYFYYGQTANHFVPNQYLPWERFTDWSWYYSYDTDIYTRAHLIKPGFPEIAIFATFFIFVLLQIVKRRIIKEQIFLSITGITILFFTSGLSVPLYEHINFLGGIQHAWRMLSAFIFIPPLLVALALHKAKSPILIFGVVVLFTILRFPQLYGKNYHIKPYEAYHKPVENLHGTIMNTVWTSNTKDYAVQSKKPAIFEGEGEIEIVQVKNALRVYRVKAETPLKMVDYTFYYPGWHVYVDGVDNPIQFQDPSYRGVITYDVPEGEHEIILKFEETKTRQVANIISVLTIIGVLGYVSFLQLRRNN